MTGTTVFGCLPGAHPYWTQKSFKSTILQNRLNKEKTPGRCCQSGYLLPWWLRCAIGSFGNLGKCYVSSPVAKTLEIMTGTTVFWMSYCGSPLLDPKKLQNEQFYIIDWIWKKTPGRCCQSGYLLPWWWCAIGGFGNPAQMLCLVVLLPKLWKSWLAQLFLDVLLWLTLTGPKKASKRTILHK